MVQQVTIALLVTLAVLAASADAQDKASFPSVVEGHRKLQPNEHPRLFFRKTDIAELRRRANTPQGKQIMARLRELLGGGEEMPTEFNPNRGKQPDGSGQFHATAPVGKTYTLWHAAGFGTLYQVTGDEKYAELARKCVDLALEGQRDRDNRYSFLQPTGALRAGPSLSAIAIAYDLCFDAWEPDYRKRIALAIQEYDGGYGSPKANEAIGQLALSPRHDPQSNHFGPQIGGAGIAIIAIHGDDGTDTAKLDRYLAGVRKNAARNLTDGFGDGGYFHEHLGPSQISSDTAFMPYLAAERTAMGIDFISPRPNAQWINLRWAMDLLSVDGKPEFPLRHPSSYGTGQFWKCRDGLSRGGQFVQAFLTAKDDPQRRALLWTYNHVVEPDPKARTFDLVSPYPHRALFALVAWPIGMEELNPAEVLPNARRDSRYHWYVFRNRWQDADDALVTLLLGGRNNGPTSPTVWALGLRVEFPFRVANARADTFRAFKDGSGVLGMPLRAGRGSFAVDFSGKCGAPVLIVHTGPGIGPTERERKGPNGASATHSVISAEGNTFSVLTVQRGPAPPVRADGKDALVGDVRVSFDGKLLRLSSFPD